MTLNEKNIGSNFDLKELIVKSESFNNRFYTKDSGERRSFESGAIRDSDAGKPRFDMIPPHALLRVAELFARGAVKYGENNWEKGIPTQQMLASAMRHLEAFRRGENDEDHLAAVVWNVLAIMQYQHEGKNTPIYFTKENNDA